MEHGLWGEPRRLWTPEAANDNARRAGGPEGGGRVFGALALKDEPEALAARKLCPIRFQGQWEDEETGLSYNRFRHYDALTGQYASPDPIGIGGGTRPQGFVTNATIWVDPLGLDPKTWQTYQEPSLKGGAPYAGRTSGCCSPEENVANRDKKHHKNDEYGPAELDKSSSNPDAIRGREQQLIDANGGAQSGGGTSGNVINGISPTNPNRGRYLGASKNEFGE